MVPAKRAGEILNLKEKAAFGCRILAKLGLADWLGHVSARVPGEDCMVIKGLGIDLGDLQKTTADKIITVGFDGKKIEGVHRLPGETPLHAEIYRAHPDVGGIVHTHQRLTLAFGTTGRKILPLQGIMAWMVEKDLPVFQSSLMVSTVDAAREVARLLGDHQACHLKNHGVVVVGKTVEEAVISCIDLEDLAHLTMTAESLGKPDVMSTEEIALKKARLQIHVDASWRYYNSLFETTE